MLSSLVYFFKNSYQIFLYLLFSSNTARAIILHNYFLKNLKVVWAFKKSRGSCKTWNWKYHQSSSIYLKIRLILVEQKENIQ